MNQFGTNASECCRILEFWRGIDLNSHVWRGWKTESNWEIIKLNKQTIVLLCFRLSMQLEDASPSPVNISRSLALLLTLRRSPRGGPRARRARRGRSPMPSTSTMGQVPVGELLPGPGATEDQLQGGEALLQHRPAGLQVPEED